MIRSAILPALSIILLALSASAYTWTHIDGRSMEADYVSATDTEVRIRRTADQMEFTMKLLLLSPDDQSYVAEQKAIEQAKSGILTTVDDEAFNSFRDRIERFTFGKSSFPARYLGTLSINDKPLGTVPYWPDGISVSSSGDIALSSGNGTTAHMKIVQWFPDGTTRDLVPLTYKKSEKGISKEERAEDEKAGRFWFFGGQVAYDRSDDLLFTLGACCDNGIFRSKQNRIQRLNTCISSSSLQVPHWDDRHAYIGRGDSLRRFKLNSNSAEEDDIVFSIEGDRIYMTNTFMLDKDHIITGISLPTDEKDDRGMTISGKFGIYIDRTAKGYYLVSSDYMGAMALDPSRNRMLRIMTTENNGRSLSEFELVH